MVKQESSGAGARRALFGGYRSPQGTYDEMFDDTTVRPAYQQALDVLDGLGTEDIANRAEYVGSTYLDQGVTFDIGGVERPFPLDIVPRIITAKEWSTVEAGVAQRIRALELFLADIYGVGQVFRDGVIPRRVVTSASNFNRLAAGVHPANGVRIHVGGIDLVRDSQGTFRVLEDNVRIPSGVSYVITNRRVMTAALPEVMGNFRVRPVGGYPEHLLSALRAAAPSGATDPNVVVLTPGVYNSAYFEHSLLARMMGVELVEGSDLVCQSGRIFAHTTRGLQRVDVIYRRVDDDFLDPVAFRHDSVLGVAGLFNAARAGTVTIANGVGNGVADDKLVYTYVPDLIRYYLGEEPIMPGVDTWRLAEPAALEEVIDRLDELVVKPVDGSGGKGVVIGPAASKTELAKLRKQLLSDPREYIAQPVVQLSTIPTLINGKMSPRHVDLRPFAVNKGHEVYVLPGGLTRVALPEGQLVVNSSQGGGSKDTWVLADRRSRPPTPKKAAAGKPRHPSLMELEGERVVYTELEQQQQEQSC